MASDTDEARRWLADNFGPHVNQRAVGYLNALDAVRSELEQVRRERDAARDDGVRASEAGRALLVQAEAERDALAATVEALREAAGEYMDALGWGAGDTEAYDAIDPEDVDRFNAAAVALRGILDKAPTAHLSERDARALEAVRVALGLIVVSDALVWADGSPVAHGDEVLTRYNAAYAVLRGSTGGDHEDR